MQFKLKTFLVIMLSITSFTVNAGADDHMSKENTPLLIQNNLREFVLNVSRSADYEITQFGNALIAYSDTEGPDYNLIFDYASDKATAVDLQQALNYASKKRYPFMLVSDQENPAKEIEDIIAEFHYQRVGVSTKMAISHADFKFNNNDEIVVKKVDNQDMLDIHSSIIDEAFGRPAGSTKVFMDPINNLFQPDSQVKVYLAYIKISGKLEPVAAAMLFLPKNKELLAGHYGWAVKSEHRKQGIMTNLVSNLILVAKQQGYSASAVQCYDASVRLAERIGFMKYGELVMYTNAQEEN